MYKAYSFLDYIRGGTEIAATISIDFTGLYNHVKLELESSYKYERKQLKYFKSEK